MMFRSVISKWRLQVAVALALSVSVSGTKLTGEEADAIKWLTVDEEDMSNSEDLSASAQQYFQGQHSFRGSGKRVVTRQKEKVFTFQNTICEKDNFSMFCNLVQSVSGGDVVSSRLIQSGKYVDFELDFTKEFTLFAPANSAFLEDGQILRTTLPPGLSIEDFLNNHIIDNRAYSFDQLSRICYFQLPTKFEGHWTRTICDPVGGTPLFQSGPGNTVWDRPRFLDRQYTDIPAGRGIVHAIDGFIKPRQFRETPSPSSSPSLSASPSLSSMPSEWPSELPSELPSLSSMPSERPSELPSELPSLSSMPSAKTLAGQVAANLLSDVNSIDSFGTEESLDRQTLPPLTQIPSTLPSTSPTPIPTTIGVDVENIDSFESPTWSPTTVDHTWAPTTIDHTWEPTISLNFVREHDIELNNEVEEQSFTTDTPTATPTVAPSFSPTASPTVTPTETPSALPSDWPSLVQSHSPSNRPTFVWAQAQENPEQAAPRQSKRERQREKRRQKRQGGIQIVPDDEPVIEEAAVIEEEGDSGESNESVPRQSKRERQREKRRKRRKDETESPSIIPTATGDESSR